MCHIIEFNEEREGERGNMNAFFQEKYDILCQEWALEPDKQKEALILSSVERLLLFCDKQNIAIRKNQWMSEALRNAGKD
jgi:hypothetical protein